MLLRAYRKLITLFPKSYRGEYGEQMVQTLADMLADQPSRLGRVTVWLRAASDLLRSLLQQNYAVVGHAYANTTPEYVRRNTQVSLLLLLPFIIVIIMNELRPDALPQSRLSVDILQFLVAGLPALAFIICAATLSVWVLAQHRQQRTSLLRSLQDVSHNWPLIAIGTFGLMMAVFIFGHDSVHCFAGNPVKEVRNISTTLQCLSQD
ncbi:MAG: hypothetical protein JWM81_101 [Candidatus Saccharibacteria bacterium]|nr:hypothetical protein [Candidatus Saccharibacteria bacterium]